MNDKDTYGPEDIEQLMLEKTFDQLYPEERSYVLQHLESESEYERMRQMLLEFSVEDEEGEDFVAPVSMRDELMEMHERKKSPPRFAIWLNSFFAPPSSDTPVYRLPIVQLAGVAACVLIGLFLLREPAADASLALEKEPIHRQNNTASSTTSDELKRMADSQEVPEQKMDKEPKDIEAARVDAEAEAPASYAEMLDKELVEDMKALEDVAEEAPEEESVAEEPMSGQAPLAADSYADESFSSDDVIMADEGVMYRAEEAPSANDLEIAEESEEAIADAPVQTYESTMSNDYSANGRPEVQSADGDRTAQQKKAPQEEVKTTSAPATKLTDEMISVLFTCR